MKLLSRPGPGRILATFLFFVLVAGSGTLANARQDRPTSLDIVPQTTAFYFASMNHAARYQAVVDSNAWQQLMSTDVAKRMRKAYRSGKRRGWGQFGYANPFAGYLQAYSETIGSDPGKLAMGFLKQIFGNEVFVYGDRDWIEVSRALTAFYRRSGEFMQETDVAGMGEAQISGLLEIAREELAGANTPTLVIGTVLNQTAGVKSLLQMAEAGLDEISGEIPEEFEALLDGFQVIERADMYLLSLQIEAEMMPWEQIEDDPEFEPYVDDIRAILANKSFNLTLGIKGQFLIFSIGPSGEHVTRLGDGDLLIEHPKLGPLKQAARSQRMASIYYNSEESVRNGYEQMPGMVDMLVNLARMGITAAEDESLDPLADELEADAEELKSDMMSMVSRPGAYLGFSYLFENGVEGFIYDWSGHQFFDGSRPLTMLGQSGTDPAIVMVARDSGSREQFAVARKWFGKAFDYVAKYAPKTIRDEEEALRFNEFVRELRPLLTRVADTTDQNLLAATENSQFGFVMDFTTTRQSWHPMMPPSRTELPIPSLALLLEHHDQAKMAAAGNDYLEVAGDLLELIREVPGAGVPDEIQVTAPQHKSAFGGDLSYYRLPMQAGMDETISPHALLTDRLLVLGYCMDQTERLMSGKSAAFEGLLADSSQPLASALYYDNRQMVDALYAWARYGIQVARDQGQPLEVGRGADSDVLAFGEPELMEALDAVVALIKCFESHSSMTYLEDDAHVTRYQMRFRDVAEK